MKKQIYCVAASTIYELTYHLGDLEENIYCLTVSVCLNEITSNKGIYIYDMYINYPFKFHSLYLMKG